MLLAESARVIFALIAVLGFIGLAAILVRKAGLISASSGLVRKNALPLLKRWLLTPAAASPSSDAMTKSI